MNPVRRISAALKNHVYSRWRQACLRQAGQLNCNPLGIIAGLVVMVGTVEIWSHARDIGMWVLLLGGLAAVALITLTLVRLLERMTVMGSPRLRQRSEVHKQPATVTRVPAEPPSLRLQAPDPVPSGIAQASGGSGILVLGPDGVEQLAEPERVQEPA
jgi:hypothetical protein